MRDERDMRDARVRNERDMRDMGLMPLTSLTPLMSSKPRIIGNYGGYRKTLSRSTRRRMWRNDAGRGMTRGT